MKEKAKAIILYLVQKCDHQLNVNKCLDLIYYADIEHLKVWGRTVSEDFYMSLNQRVIPQHLFSVLGNLNPYENVFITNDTIISRDFPDLDCLSKSDIEMLDKAYDKSFQTDFNTIIKTTQEKILLVDTLSDSVLAECVGASPEMIEYIKEREQYRNICF